MPPTMFERPLPTDRNSPSIARVCSRRQLPPGIEHDPATPRAFGPVGAMPSSQVRGRPATRSRCAVTSNPEGGLGRVLAGEVLVLHLPRVVERVESRVSDEEGQGP